MLAQDLGINVIEVVESIYGLEGKLKNDEYRIHCPSPQHSDQHPSTDVNINSGLWKCLSCAAGGDIIKLGTLALGKSHNEILELLKPSSVESKVVILGRKIKSLASPIRKKKLELPGPYPPDESGYLLERGFKPETIKKWGIGWVDRQTLHNGTNKFTLRDCLAIPIRDRDNHLLSYVYRATDESPLWQRKQARYIYTPGVVLSDLWFGLQHNAEARHVIVVEGPLDVMWLDQAGYPALGLLGAHNRSEKKVRWLSRYESITLLGDRDAAGIKSVMEIGKLLSPIVALRIARYPSHTITDPNEKLDPQTLDPIDLELALERAIPWTKFKNKMKG